MIGSTLAAAGGSAVQWKGLVSKVIIPAALSPIIAALVAALGTWLLYRISRSLTRNVYGGNVLGLVIAAICFLIILAALGWGIYEVYQIGHPAPAKH